MATVTVPLTDEMLEQISDLIRRGVASNKADAIRKALQMYLEEQAVKAVLDAASEPDLEGDLDELAAKL